MVPAKEKKLRKQITDLLKEKKLYEGTDDLLIEELIFQYELIDAAKAEIRTNGMMINVRAEGVPLFQANQAVNIYQQANKTLLTISTKLGISPTRKKQTKVAG